MKLLCTVTLISIACSLSSTKELPNACTPNGRTQYEDSGKILSPNYPENYPNQMSCRWNLFPERPTLPAFAVVTLVDVEMEGAGCTRDKIVIDKATVCGNESNVCIVYTNQEKPLDECTQEKLDNEYKDCIKLNLDKWPVAVEFESDLLDNYKGFHIDYKFVSCFAKKPQQSYDNDQNNNSGASSMGMYIGIAVGVVGFIVLVVVMALFIVSRQRRIDEKKNTNNSDKNKELLGEAVTA